MLGTSGVLLADEVRMMRQRARDAVVRPALVEATAGLLNGLTPARLLLGAARSCCSWRPTSAADRGPSGEGLDPQADGEPQAGDGDDPPQRASAGPAARRAGRAVRRRTGRSPAGSAADQAIDANRTKPTAATEFATPRTTFFMALPRGRVSPVPSRNIASISTPAAAPK